jgi:hypothetical protein
MIIEIPNYIKKETIEEIKNSISPYIHKCDDHVAFYRDGNTVPISQIPELKDLDNKLHDIFTQISYEIVSPRFQPRYKSCDTGYDYHVYNPNDICNIHSDGEINENRIRYASVILHLNTVEDGGELIFPNHNKKIKTEEGKVVVFPPSSSFLHYTTPSNTPREVIVSWFCYENVKVDVQEN